MMTETEKSRLLGFVEDAIRADSPDKFAYASMCILESLAEDAERGGAACEDAWTDASAGKPWYALARKLRRAAGAFNLEGTRIRNTGLSATAFR